jgi:DNA-binding transcriptional ArsR family regulator
MQPVYHPPLENITLEGILFALSDPLRMRIFVDIYKSETAVICARFLNIDDKVYAKSTISQSFKVLRDCGLIWTVRKGVEALNTTRYEELKEKFGPLLDSIISAYLAQNSAI